MHFLPVALHSNYEFVLSFTEEKKKKNELTTFVVLMILFKNKQTGILLRFKDQSQLGS